VPILTSEKEENDTGDKKITYMAKSMHSSQIYYNLNIYTPTGMLKYFKHTLKKLKREVERSIIAEIAIPHVMQGSGKYTPRSVSHAWPTSTQSRS
jgi:hypothetical protein